MITYVFVGVTRNKILSNVSKFREWTTRLCKKTQHQQFQLQDTYVVYVANNIPEVVLNYREYHEPRATWRRLLTTFHTILCSYVYHYVITLP